MRSRPMSAGWNKFVNLQFGRGLTAVDKMTSSSVIIGKPVGGESTVRLESNPPSPIWISIARDKDLLNPSNQPSDLWLCRETRVIYNSLPIIVDRRKKYHPESKSIEVWIWIYVYYVVQAMLIQWKKQVFRLDFKNFIPFCLN